MEGWGRFQPVTLTCFYQYHIQQSSGLPTKRIRLVASGNHGKHWNPGATQVNLHGLLPQPCYCSAELMQLTIHFCTTPLTLLAPCFPRPQSSCSSSSLKRSPWITPFPVVSKKQGACSWFCPGCPSAPALHSTDGRGGEGGEMGGWDRSQVLGQGPRGSLECCFFLALLAHDHS